jgi:hypothetical protein
MIEPTNICIECGHKMTTVITQEINTKVDVDLDEFMFINLSKEPIQTRYFWYCDSCKDQREFTEEEVEYVTYD